MSKELEALERIRQDINAHNDYRNDFEDLKMIEQALQELQEIKSAEPSEALDKFDYIGNDIKFAYDDDYVSYDYTDDVEYIKNTLIKAQEQEKDIIHYKGTVENLRRDNALLKDIKDKQEKIINELKTLVKYADLGKQRIVSLAVLKNALKEVL